MDVQGPGFYPQHHRITNLIGADHLADTLAVSRWIHAVQESLVTPPAMFTLGNLHSVAMCALKNVPHSTARCAETIQIPLRNRMNRYWYTHARESQ